MSSTERSERIRNLATPEFFLALLSYSTVVLFYRTFIPLFAGFVGPHVGGFGHGPPPAEFVVEADITIASVCFIKSPFWVAPTMAQILRASLMPASLLSQDTR